MQTNLADAAIDHIYNTLDGSFDMRDFSERHRIESLNVLTVLNPADARQAVAKFLPHITGRCVVEIGGGVGYLALEMAKHAKSVIAIENDPAWSWVFTKFLYRNKPANLTWIFGHSRTIEIRADVAVISSRSGLSSMVSEARRFANEICLISCEEPFVADANDPTFDALAEYTKLRTEQLFGDAEEALNNPDKRAAYEATTGGVVIDWDELQRRRKLCELQ